MKSLLAICAAGSAVDRFTNRLSIFNVVEQFTSPTFPIWVPEITFIVALRKEDDEPANIQARCRVEVGENMISEGLVNIDFGPNNIARQIANFQGLPIPTPGDVTFRLMIPNGDQYTIVVPAVRVRGNIPEEAAAPA